MKEFQFPNPLNYRVQSIKYELMEVSETRSVNPVTKALTNNTHWQIGIEIVDSLQ